MDNTQKMLQIIINGQSSFRQEVLGKIDKVEGKIKDVEKNLSGKIDKVEGKIDRVETNLTERIDKVEKNLNHKIDKIEEKLTKRIDKVEINLTKRIDTLGKQLAYLEDDAPTREEFGNLEIKIDKLASKSPSVI